MQLPTASVRDYTGVIAGGGGTTMLVQWREGMGSGQHLGLDLGFADPRNSTSMRFFAAATGGRELLRASQEQPVDVMLTAGVSAARGGGATLYRVPIGATMGHTFELDQDMTLTPFVHPRISYDVCGRCSEQGRQRSEISLNFDLGASFRINHQYAIRAAATFTGSNRVGGDGAFAVGFNWTPPAVTREQQ